MSHELVAFPNGSFSVKPLGSPGCTGYSNEAMHSHIGPWQEAELIYVGQSGLSARLSEGGTPLVVFDLGMGIAANALAALERFLESGPQRDLHLVSFEKHLDGLRLAMTQPEKFPWIQRHRAALEQLLDLREWSCTVGKAKFRWQLCEGDFLHQDLTAYPAAELIFFDFYSPKACPELWDVPCFEKIRMAASEQAELFTYGASTAARSAMLLAGWSVGVGCPTEAKSETTVAAARFADLAQPLGAEWLQKLGRSEKPLPPGTSFQQREHAMAGIHRHPQFAGEKLQ